MITIGICEDVERTRGEIQQLCRKTAGSLHMDCEIREFADGVDFMQDLGYILKGGNGISDGTLEMIKNVPDILILDIELPGVNGIEIKNWLQAKEIKTLIIFVTNHGEQMRDAFGVHVFGFVEKNRMETQLVEMLQSALQMTGRFVIIGKGIDSRDVLYIQSEHIYSRIWLKNGQSFLLREGLNRLEELLQQVDFIRIHRSCLVNMKYVQELEGRQVYIFGEKLAVSTREWRNVKKKYCEYCRKNARYC